MSRTSAETAVLASRLHESQDITTEKVSETVDRLAAADDDLWLAAMSWATTGVMPSEPVVRGYCASNLDLVMNKPTVVFTTLVALREDASAALVSLHHSPWRAVERLTT